MGRDDSDILLQHLIDPEICIRCNTCEATCPVQAITHDDRNYVVDAEKCNLCMACISPCPTGAAADTGCAAAEQPARRMPTVAARIAGPVGRARVRSTPVTARRRVRAGWVPPSSPCACR